MLALALAGCAAPADEAVPVAAPEPVVVATPTASATPVATGAGAGSLPLVPPSTGLETPAAPQVPTADLVDDHDPEVALVQQRLTELRYYADVVDGQMGPRTTTALQAFQKVQGLPVDGVIGPEVLAALDDPVLPEVHAGAPDRIDIDLDDQVLFVTLGGRLERIMPISSGNGEPYTLPGGFPADSLTPVGTFAVHRVEGGSVDAHFGRLYDPMYFYKGWAIHGSNNVPAVPASHGCVRLPVPDAEWLFERVAVGMPVTVWGSRNSFNPAAGETAGTDTPAGDPGPPAPPPPPPPGPAFG